jgi:peptidyl-prolyl cis-trans isomerase D
MAVIGSIRKRSGLLIIIIGVALAAFVLGDFVKSNPKRSVNIGSVEGDEITIMDFNREVDKNIENTKQQQNKERLSSKDTYTVRDQTWEQMVRTLIMSEQYDELGIKVTSDELFDLVQGPNPHALIKQYFTNPETGQYDRALVLNYLQNLDQLPAQSKAQWVQFENYIKEDRLLNKYNNLVSKAYYIPEELAKMVYADDNNKAKIEYAAIKYIEIADSLVNVTDDDYDNYFDENKYRYEQKAARDLDYVTFNVVPSQGDMTEATKDVMAIYEDFKNTTSAISFVNANSDNSYDSTWRAEGGLPVQIDSIMFNSEVGTVARPYRSGNVFHTARLLETSMRPDSMKASHILIAYAGAMRSSQSRTAVDAKLLADSLLAVVKKSPKKLEKLAVEFSNDGSVAQNSGDLGWFADGNMVPSFNQAVIDTKLGGITIVESPFGFHVIKVTGKKELEKKIRVAMIDHEILPSTETYQIIFAKASKLASENRNIEDFNNAIKELGLNKRSAPKIQEMSNNIAGVENARQIVRWTFNEDVEAGTVSDVFDLDGMYLVAAVAKTYAAGYPAMEDVKSRIKTFVYNKKKGEYITEKLKAYNGDLDKIVSELGATKQTVTDLSFSTRNLQGFGRENLVIGSVFAQANGTTTKPISGAAATFVVKVDNIVDASGTDYSASTKKIISALQRRVNQDYIYKAIKEVSEIEDNRLTFY